MNFEPNPEGLARREEIGFVLGKLSAFASQENNVYVTSDILAFQDEILDRYQEIGVEYGIPD